LLKSQPPSIVPSVSSLTFWSQPAPQRALAFEELRRIAPVSYQEPPDSGVGAGPGFWAITRHSDVVSVSRRPHLFCSGQGVGFADTPELLEYNKSFVVMDPPSHTMLRRVVSGAFTPRKVAQLGDRIGAEAERIVDAFVESGGGDVVEDFSKKLPLWTICEMLGIPESMRTQLSSATEALSTGQEHELASDVEHDATIALQAGMAIHRIARAVIADRRSHPGDDIFSALVHCTIDGQPLCDQVLRNIFVLLVTAGNDTTRNTTSFALKLFSDHPSQWSLLVRDPSLVGSAVEELVRCATPVTHFRRTARADTELGGVHIAKGELVVMFYESANRDASVFQSPDTFDITRDPNPHVGFGGGGPHFCLGANLARVELRSLVTRLAARVASIEAGTPSYLLSKSFNGITRMPVSLVANNALTSSSSR
jgi:cytochrome P450